MREVWRQPPCPAPLPSQDKLVLTLSLNLQRRNTIASVRLTRRLEKERPVSPEQRRTILICKVAVCRSSPMTVTIRLQQEVASIPQRPLNQIPKPKLHLIGTRGVHARQKAIGQREQLAAARVGLRRRPQREGGRVLRDGRRTDEPVVCGGWVVGRGVVWLPGSDFSEK
mgnify:CR=1 FL=1